MALRPDLFDFRKIASRVYPVVGVLSTHVSQQISIDVKSAIPDEIAAAFFLRLNGTIVKAGAGPGAATGRENPEALIRSVSIRQSPSLGALAKQNLTARSLISMGLFDRGYSIREADITDAAATITIDVRLPLMFKMPNSINPIEWAIPMSFFDEFQIVIDCGGRQELFTGGTNTWDLTGLQLEIWGDMDIEVPGKFHLMDEFTQTFNVTQTQRDALIELASGWVYTHLLIESERDNVLVDNIVNNIALRSGGRNWLTEGQVNGAMIRRANQEVVLPSEALTGLYFLNLLRDGMVSRSVEALQDKLAVILDVTRTSGVETITVHGRRIFPEALEILGAAA